MRSLVICLSLIFCLSTISASMASPVPKKIAPSNSVAKELGFELSLDIQEVEKLMWIIDITWPASNADGCTPTAVQVFSLDANGTDLGGVSFNQFDMTSQSSMFFYFQPEMYDRAVQFIYSCVDENGTSQAIRYTVNSVKEYFSNLK